MDSQQRLAFWRALCACPGKNYDKEFEDLLLPQIQFPPVLFRYRSITPQQLAALQNNRIYFSTPNHYDDPFDTHLHINASLLNEHVLSFLQDHFDESDLERYIRATFQLSSSDYSAFFSSMSFQEKIAKVKDMAINPGLLRALVQQNTYSVCFSDSVTNETLWLKYADQHRGFTLAYDLRCFAPPLRSASSSATCSAVLPVAYTDEKFDATAFAEQIMKWSLLHRSQSQADDLAIEKYRLLEKETNSAKNLWDTYRIALIKKRCHEYDAEWRIFLHGSSIQLPAYIEVKPTAVILGLRTSPSDKELVAGIAGLAGIHQIYEIYVNDQDDLDAKPYSVKT